MPAGLVNLLADRGQFLDLVAYLVAIAEGGPSRAAELRPDPAFFAAAEPAVWENDIDHAAFVSDWADPSISLAALKRGGDIYQRVCANCHGTLDAAGSLPTAPRFAQAAEGGQRSLQPLSHAHERHWPDGGTDLDGAEPEVRRHSLPARDVLPG